MSKLFRNVPFLTSLEVSPFRFGFLFFSWLLALPGAKPCGARRAERLGRSGGQGQRRARQSQSFSPRFPLRPAAGGLAPRVICRLCSSFASESVEKCGLGIVPSGLGRLR